jgi:hypothetical protein
MQIVSIIFALLVLMGSDPAVALTAHPAAPRCASCLHAQEIQNFDCNSVARVMREDGSCDNYCRNFAQTWGSAPGWLSDCLTMCNTKAAECAGGGGGGGGVSQPNCQWYSQGNIRKRICRIY